jgi:hypothetical protein
MAEDAAGVLIGGDGTPVRTSLGVRRHGGMRVKRQPGDDHVCAVGAHQDRYPLARSWQTELPELLGQERLWQQTGGMQHK